MDQPRLEPGITAVAALDEPVRRQLYDYVCAQTQPVTRDRAAAALGIGRSLAAFHLDKLAANGLLDVDFRRVSGRTGPGSGRPAKLYRRSGRQVQVTLPPRQYELAARLLAAALADIEHTHRRAGHAVRNAARARGEQFAQLVRARIGRSRSIAATERALLNVLRDLGYQPHTRDNTIHLANCPFEALARSHTELICGMNLELLRSLTDALPRLRITPQLDPAPDRCCVTFARTAAH
jgi:predicted ArsR family transcriptional regulator